MKKTKFIRACCCTAALIVLLSALPSAVFAYTDADKKAVEDQINEKKNEIWGIGQQLKELENNAASTEQKLEVLNQKITAIQEEIRLLTERGNQLNDSIAAKTEQARRKQEELDARSRELKEQLRLSYEEGSENNLLSIFLSSSSLSSMLTRTERMRSMSEYREKEIKNLDREEKALTELLAQLKSEKEEVVSNKEELRIEQDELMSAVIEANDYYAELAENREELENKRKELDQQEKDLEAQGELIEADLERQREEARRKAEEERKRREEEERRRKEEEQRRQEELRKQENRQTTAAGEYMWPLPTQYTYISSYAGWRIHPVYGGWRYHNGTDIPAPTGTNVYASNEGLVIYAGWDNSYGYYVKIDHGNGVVTLYAHNSQLCVSTGQWVAKGTIIAKAGSTGDSTGAHCHFELRINGVVYDVLDTSNPYHAYVRIPGT